MNWAAFWLVLGLTVGVMALAVVLAVVLDWLSDIAGPAVAFGVFVLLIAVAGATLAGWSMR